MRCCSASKAADAAAAIGDGGTASVLRKPWSASVLREGSLALRACVLAFGTALKAFRTFGSASRAFRKAPFGLAALILHAVFNVAFGIAMRGTLAGGSFQRWSLSKGAVFAS